MRIKLIDSEASLLVEDFQRSGGASNIYSRIEGHVGAQKVFIQIKIDQESPIVQKAIRYMGRPIKAILEANRAVYIKDLELWQKDKNPFTLEGWGWLSY